jgi:hypothetical protein
MTPPDEIDYTKALEELKVANHFYGILQIPGLSMRDKLWYMERMREHHSRYLRIIDGKAE